MPKNISEGIPGQINGGILEGFTVGSPGDMPREISVEYPGRILEESLMQPNKYSVKESPKNFVCESREKSMKKSR